ncbi:MAG: D-TA family PLP-dependent enzyme [Planctomycetota bacterium]|jgi:D-serine deaminase-like pyridoxal phosphate-dependent protein
MDARYQIAQTSQIVSPGLVIFKDMVEQNLDHMIEIAGSPDRLRPHCKTHKTAEIIKLQLERGITRHKCATFAEAEMVAGAGAKDIFLAYSLVGPNVQRALKFVEAFPDVTFAVTADHPAHVSQLADAMQQARLQIGVMLDIDTGQHRTGIPVGDAAKDLYQQIVDAEGLIAAGFHVYDGHQHQTCRDERRDAVNFEWNKVMEFRRELEAAGLEVPRLVCGGTASFPIYAEKDEPGIEMSPGTCVYNDCGYGQRFPDMVFPPAALLLTRVISRPTDDRITLDLGYKAVASDPPMDKRAEFPELPDAKIVLQNEEHLVIESSRAGEFQPGDELLAIPRHICPTSALHKAAWVVSNGEVVGTWEIASRDRWITI